MHCGKKILSLILATAFLFSLVACGGDHVATPEETGNYTVNYHDSVTLSSIDSKVEFSDFSVENLADNGTGNLSFYITLHLPSEVNPTVYAAWFSNFKIGDNEANCELVTMGADGTGRYVQISEDSDELSDAITYHVFCSAKVSETVYSMTCSIKEDLNFEFVISASDVSMILFEQAEELFADEQYDDSLAYYELITGTQKGQADIRIQSIECLNVIDSLNATIEGNYNTTTDFLGQYMDALFNTSVSAEGSYDIATYTYNLRIYFSSMFSDIAGILGASLGEVVGNSGGVQGTHAKESYEIFREAGFDSITCYVEYCDYEGNVIESDTYTKDDYERESESQIQQEKAAGIEHIGDFTIQKGTLIEYSGNSTNVEIPNTVSTIGADAFQGNQNLQSVDIPDSVVVIESGAFLNCKNLQDVHFSNNLKIIGFRAFEGCSLETLVYPASIEQVDSYAFSMNDIKQVTFLPGIATIPQGVCNFTSITTLAEIIIPEGVKSIDGYAFMDLKVSTITLPSSLEKIEEHAFERVNADTINYNGTISQYSNITIESVTSNGEFSFGPINCTDGVFDLHEKTSYFIEDGGF